MSRITRAVQKIFASSATNNGVFGSAQDGTKILSNDVKTLQEKAGWFQGWLSAVMGSSKLPPLEEFQALDYITTYQLAYLFQEGIAEWDADTTYYANSWVKKSGSNQIYISLVNSNTALLTDTASWKLAIDFDNTRLKLAANATYWVSPSGNDSTGNGTVGTPWKTLQHAWNYVQKNLDLNGYVVNIRCADGTYADSFTPTGRLLGQTSPESLVITGNTITPGSVTLKSTTGDALQANAGAMLKVEYMDMTTTGSGNNCITTNEQSFVRVGSGIRFGNAVNCHMDSGSSSLIEVSANYSIYGGAYISMSATDSGNLISNNVTATIIGTPAFTRFANAGLLGEINANGFAFTGSATGQRYNAQGNAVIYTAGGGASFFPGNSAGSTATGGQYL